MCKESCFINLEKARLISRQCTLLGSIKVDIIASNNCQVFAQEKILFYVNKFLKQKLKKVISIRVKGRSDSADTYFNMELLKIICIFFVLAGKFSISVYLITHIHTN